MHDSTAADTKMMCVCEHSMSLAAVKLPWTCFLWQRLCLNKSDVKSEPTAKSIIRERIVRRAAVEFRDDMYGILIFDKRMLVLLCLCEEFHQGFFGFERYFHPSRKSF